MFKDESPIKPEIQPAEGAKELSRCCCCVEDSACLLPGSSLPPGSSLWPQLVHSRAGLSGSVQILFRNFSSADVIESIPHVYKLTYIKAYVCKTDAFTGAETRRWVACRNELRLGRDRHGCEHLLVVGDLGEFSRTRISGE